MISTLFDFNRSASRFSNAPRSVRRLLYAVVPLLLAATLLDSVVSAQRPAAKPPAKAPAKPPTSRLPAAVRTVGPPPMEVAPVIAARRSEAAVQADQIDHLIEARLSRAGLQPHPLTDDETFLRRVYLDVAGRIPSLDEALEFLESDEPNRRAELIDRLLSSPDYVSNLYNFWADVLRLVQYPQSNIVSEPYLAYVKDQIRRNRQYDQWVYEMLTANGKLWENPATGFQLRDEGMPLAYVDNTVRVFLGTQIGCAQCHDHPFDKWKQVQFYQLAAYTAGTRTRNRPPGPAATKPTDAQPATRKANDLIVKSREKSPQQRSPGEFQRIVRANTYEVHEVKAMLKLPHDYAYADAKPGDVVSPSVLWGAVPVTAEDNSRREQFAAWLTSADNPRFSQTIVNRLWKRFFGIGLVEPIDDFRDDTESVNDKLLEFLAAELVRLDFDMKEWMRMVLYSKTYQRTADDYQLTSGQPYYFPGPVVRRMTAEQVWDSILTLTVRNPWAFQRATADDLRPNIDLNLHTATLADAERVAALYKDSYHEPAYRRRLNQFAYQGNFLCKSSELPSPLPAEHFLRQFGQGDRETINGQDDSASVPQILAMFNGPITHVMLESGSVIYDNVNNSSNVREAVDKIFLSVLTRRPGRDDQGVATREANRSDPPTIGLGNVIWALLNTREFLFIQ